MPTEFTPLPGLVGGVLIGLSAIMLLTGLGRIAGISGIFGGLIAVKPRSNFLWRLTFIAGLILGAALTALAGVLDVTGLAFPFSLWTAAAAGLLVGIGTTLGGGCTSGHGVCGIARLSPRSIAATLTFMAVAAAVVFAVRHGLG